MFTPLLAPIVIFLSTKYLIYGFTSSCCSIFSYVIVCPFVLLQFVGFWFLLWYLQYAGFWLHLWYLLVTPLVSSGYSFGIFWFLLWYLLVTHLLSSICRLLVTPLISSGDCFGIFWLLLLYLLVTPLVSSGYSFAIFNLSVSSYSFGSCETVALYGPFVLAKKKDHKGLRLRTTPLISSGFSCVRQLFVSSCDTEL